MSISIELKPQVFLLNMLPKELDRANKHILVNIVSVARTVYATYWKKADLPNIKELIDKVYQTV